MPAPIQSALIFLISSLFDIYLFILVIRLILAFVGANYFDPITQFIIKLTDPIIKPLRRRVPNLRRIEFSTLLVILILECCKFSLIILLENGTLNSSGLLLLTIGDTLKLIVQSFFYAILLRVILSWVQPASNANYLLMQFTSPIMRPLYRIIPPVGGFDITPIPALILLQLLQIILVMPVISMGYSAALS